MSGLRMIAPPAMEPFDVGEAKEHLRVDESADDLLIARLILAARQDLDGREGRLMGVALMTQTWDLYLDAFPMNEICLPLRPLQEIVSIKYDDTNGTEQTVSSTDYIVDIASYRGRVVLAPGKSWPAARDAINSVRVRFKAGYGNTPEAVPAIYRQAMLLLIGHLYEHRGDAEAPEPPPSYFALLGVRGRVA